VLININQIYSVLSFSFLYLTSPGEGLGNLSGQSLSSFIFVSTFELLCFLSSFIILAYFMSNAKYLYEVKSSYILVLVYTFIFSSSSFLCSCPNFFLSLCRYSR